MSPKQKRILAALTLTGSLAFCQTAGIWGSAAIYDWPQPSQIMAGQTISLPGVQGEDVAFFCSDLEFRMGLKSGSLEEITVTQVPDENEGGLTAAGKPVKQYDVLNRSQINQMVYSPKPGADSAAVSFIPKAQEDAGATTVSITLNQERNNPPVTESVVISTMEDVPVQGTIPVYDAEGDQIKIQVVQAPKKGEVSFQGASLTYTPFLGMTGEDRFSFVCQDKAGNYSQEKLCDISIEKKGGQISYLDMSNNPSHYSAIKLWEKGVWKGETIGSGAVFSPKQTVSRKELLLLALKALGAGVPEPCVNTKLSNDSQIPLWLKPYVRQGIELGLITESKFSPDEIPTRAEAVALIARAAGMEDVKQEALRMTDAAAIPNWAIQSYLNLSAYQMLDLYDGTAKPNAALTRDTAADLVWQLWKYRDSVRETK